MNEEKKFYRLTNDTTFKYLFKKENIREIFFKIIKYYTDLDLYEYRLLDNELDAGNLYSDYRLDILLENKDKDILVNIEMNEKDYDYHEKKGLRYVERIAGNTFNKKENIKVYQVNFCDYYCKYDKKRITDNYMMRNEDNTNSLEDIKIYNIFIPRVIKSCCSEVDYMLKLFQVETIEEARKIAGNNKEMNILVDEIEKLNKDKYYGALYSEKESKEYDEWYYTNKGREEGIKEGILQTAKKMLKKEVDINLISELTGLSKKEIEDLK